MTDDLAWKRFGMDAEPEGPGITDVNCTPRHRRGESQESFQARMAGYAKEFDALKSRTNKRNRAGAVGHPIFDSNGQAWFTAKCACKWHSLQARDPEVARREYDAHACSLVDADGGWQPGQTLHRKSEVPLVQTDWVAQTKAMLSQHTEDDTPVVTVTEADDSVVRFSLLELK